MTSTNTDPYAAFRFAPDERPPLPGEWFGNLGGGPLWCDGYEGQVGIIAHVYSLPGDPVQYVIPKPWRWVLHQETGRAMYRVTATKAADTAAEAMHAAEAALADYYAKHRPAEGYAALTEQARRAGFAIEEAPAAPGDAGAGLDEDEPRTIRVRVPADDADDTQTRQPLTDLARLIAQGRCAADDPESTTS